MADMFRLSVIVMTIMTRATFSIEITLLHTNDFHAHFEQSNLDGDRCSEEDVATEACYGGVARMVTKVRELRASNQNTILLDAGDQLQGSNWYYHYEGRATAYFYNMIGYDALALSNHEFDGGITTLVSYLDRLLIPVVSCNIDPVDEPDAQGFWTKSIVLTVSGEKIGIVGYTTTRTKLISNPGKLKFQDEVESIRKEVNSLSRDGLNKIIVIGSAEHTMSITIANEVEGVDIVVGTDPATLRTRGNAKPTDEEVHGEYPFVVRQSRSDDLVLVVQVQIFFRYLGFLRVTFDEEGKIISYSGEPILLDQSIEEDPAVLDEIEEWAKPIRLMERNIVGQTYVRLNGEAATCRVQECNLGNLVTDAMLAAFMTNQGEDGWSDVSIALALSGGIRDSIPAGDITASDIHKVLPFGGTVDMIELRGHHLLEALERSVEEFDILLLPGFFLQVSGLKVKYDLSASPGHRVTSVRVRCSRCSVPSYGPLEMNEVYKVVVSDYMSEGGDGYLMIKENKQNVKKGNLDATVLSQYIQKHSPITHGIEGRIHVVGEPSSSSSIQVLISVMLAAVGFAAFVY